MKTIEELEKENEDLRCRISDLICKDDIWQNEVDDLRIEVANARASSELWWKKSQELEAKLKALKEIINVI